MVSGHSQDPISPRTHPRWRNTGRALAPPLLSANLLHKPPAPCPAEGSGWPACFRSAIAPSKPPPHRCLACPLRALYAVTPGGAVLHPVGANPQPAAPLARFPPPLWQSRRGCRPPACFGAAIAPSSPSLKPAPSAPNPAHIPHAVTPGGAVLHPVGANPQPAAPLARFPLAL